MVALDRHGHMGLCEAEERGMADSQDIVQGGRNSPHGPAPEGDGGERRGRDGGDLVPASRGDMQVDLGESCAPQPRNCVRSVTLPLRTVEIRG